MEFKKPIWERQKKERKHWFDAFCVYRNWPYENNQPRSLEKTHQKLTEGSPKLALRTVKKWSADWEWVARAEAYDQHKAEEAQQEEERLARIAREAKEEEARKNAAKWAKRSEEESERVWEQAELLCKKALDMHRTSLEETRWILKDLLSFIKLENELRQKAFDLENVGINEQQISDSQRIDAILALFNQIPEASA